MTDGSLHTEQALRVRTDNDNLYLEHRSSGDWSPVFGSPLADIEQVQRRYTEYNGRWVWVTESLPATQSEMK
ncbi:hypothetical protein [Nocardiopsis rhodophaea]|uniref:hypothetical protein n=1 Tax=Nocardiopsis rhodophaea TaxID=280238 RepID=UPI0031E0A34C